MRRRVQVRALAATPGLFVISRGSTRRYASRKVDAIKIGKELNVRYVLSGGEPAAMVICDAVMRKLPGALGHEHSALEESYSEALEGAQLVCKEWIGESACDGVAQLRGPQTVDIGKIDEGPPGQSQPVAAQMK